MIRLVTALVIFYGLFSEAKVAPEGMTEFNKKCPTPKLCETIYENLQQCEKGKKSIAASL